jgi:starvation-inducible outer membrane lipoprotein
MENPLMRLILLCGAALVLTGCMSGPPKAWEKGALAKPEMRMAGDTLDERFQQHTYASKEAASGGYGVGGGGCGCN